MTLYPKNLIVTIDGPSGAGKSTIASALASELNGKKLDTGAIYRSFAYFLKSQNISMEDTERLFKEAENFRCKFQENGKILLNGEDISQKIRTPEVSSEASKVASVPVVRQGLLNLQRELAENGPTVCEGRDMGTVVFPEATVKFFLTASPEVRAERRYEELKAKGNKQVTYEQILEDQKERDYRDSHREIAPLKRPEDAVLIDSDNKTIREIVDFCLSVIENKLKK